MPTVILSAAGVTGAGVSLGAIYLEIRELSAAGLTVSLPSLTIVMQAIIITRTKNAVMLTSIDADWLWTEVFPSNNGGIPLNSVLFEPGSDNDIMVIRDGSKTGPIIFKRKALKADNLPSYFNGSKYKPVIDFSECTLNAGHSVTIMLERG